MTTPSGLRAATQATQNGLAGAGTRLMILKHFHFMKAASSSWLKTSWMDRGAFGLKVLAEIYFNSIKLDF